MQLVEKHNINKNNSLFNEINKLSFLSKNLYNRANYYIRQTFIISGYLKEDNLIEKRIYLNYNDINEILKNDETYKTLPAKVSQQILMNLDKNWKSFFASIRDWKINPSKYRGKPSLPKYKDKTNGKNLLIYTIQAISKNIFKKEKLIKLSGTSIKINSKIDYNNIKQVRIIPKLNNNYVIEIIYEKKEINLNLDSNNILGIDIGVNNLMTLTSNKKGILPVLVNGRPLKSVNQYYNKKLAQFKSELPYNPKTGYQLGVSNKIKRLTLKRNNKIEDGLHKASKFIIDFCKINNIGTIVIGHNNLWKTKINLSDKTNQNFVTIPFNSLIQKINYKGKMVGINVIVREESYTSKASFLNLDIIPDYKPDEKIKYKFSGYRMHRGLYKIKGKKVYINADVNGSYNILRKEFPNAFADGIEGLVVNPIRIKSYKLVA